ncbi:flagellum-specific ATP synthase FliI [Zhengella mangrovi]|uniref:Flagellum-specific ATP synthase FliI n=1 Tax=Zhengella mangrovi TaxID=1982044 RepID=A0A2G1QJP1_9HYPH|nr:FliI/YscN family ATPase [Zhengella mangrovi]PHP65736.1 flagellum-specific ATP synthase FliI [Zhengella mangrovi]
MTATLDHLEAMTRSLEASILRGGYVDSVSAGFYRVRGLETDVALNDTVWAESGGERHWGKVIRIDPDAVIVAPYKTVQSLRRGDVVLAAGRSHAPRPNMAWLGRVLDALGEPVDGGGAIPVLPERRNGPRIVPALDRARVDAPFQTGVNVADVFTPLCYGQRIGIFAGSGVGKSTLLSMFARSDAFDVAVIALVGERSREVREFLEDTVGPESLARTVTIVATSDESAMMRCSAPVMAMDAAEYFRDRGMRVLVMVDSVTRYAHALREVGIALGEPPIARGYPPSVFAALPQLMERAGPGREDSGSITAIATVLVDGDDHNEPVADTMRGILDGHLVLDRHIADQGRFPAVNILASLSRLALRVWTDEQRLFVTELRGLMARYEETREIRMLGGWMRGADPALDQAVDLVPVIYDAMKQGPHDPLSQDPFGDLARRLKERQRQAQQPDAAPQQNHGEN